MAEGACSSAKAGGLVGVSLAEVRAGRKGDRRVGPSGCDGGGARCSAWKGATPCGEKGVFKWEGESRDDERE